LAFFTYPKPAPQGLNAAEYQRWMHALNQDGVTSGLVVSAPSATTVRASAGEARVGGFGAYSDSASSDYAITTIVSGSRPDRLVLRLTWTGSSSDPTALTIAPAIKQATPPPLTQAYGGTWEIGLAQWTTTPSGIGGLWNEIRWDGAEQIRSYTLARTAVPPSGAEAGVLGYKLVFVDDTGNNSANTFPVAVADSGANLILYGPGHYAFVGEVSFPSTPVLDSVAQVRCEQSANGGASWGIVFQRTYKTINAPSQNQFGFQVPALKFAAGDRFRVSLNRQIPGVSNEDINGNVRVSLVRAIPVP
jgi:hypothetical protein